MWNQDPGWSGIKADVHYSIQAESESVTSWMVDSQETEGSLVAVWQQTGTV